MFKSYVHNSHQTVGAVKGASALQTLRRQLPSAAAGGGGKARLVGGRPGRALHPTLSPARGLPGTPGADGASFPRRQSCPAA